METESHSNQNGSPEMLFHNILGHGSRLELESMVNSGMNWKRKFTEQGLSVLHICAMNGNIEAAEYFISIGAGVNARCDSGKTPLIMATYSQNNFIEIVDLLLNIGADINTCDHKGNLITYATTNGKSKEELESLVSRGCDWTMKDELGATILHHAAVSGNLDALKLFISKGGDVHTKDFYGYSVISYALNAKKNRSEIVGTLMEQGAQFEDLASDCAALLAFNKII